MRAASEHGRTWKTITTRAGKTIINTARKRSSFHFAQTTEDDEFLPVSRLQSRSILQRERTHNEHVHTSPCASARASFAEPVTVALRRSTSAGAAPPSPHLPPLFVDAVSARRQGSPSSSAMARASSCLFSSAVVVHRCVGFVLFG